MNAEEPAATDERGDDTGRNLNDDNQPDRRQTDRSPGGDDTGRNLNDDNPADASKPADTQNLDNNPAPQRPTPPEPPHHANTSNANTSNLNNEPAATDEREAAEPSYASAMRELEQILDELEAEEPDVDMLAERVNRAAELIKICRQRITNASVQVERIVAALEPETGP